MPRCVCGHSDEMHFAGVKEGHKLTDFACCYGNCKCKGWQAESEQRFTRALVFAAQAHQGQVYPGYGNRVDEPYILHPLRVAMAVPEHMRVVALLHDVFEDTDAELDDYTPEWLTAEERDALRTLTRKGEPYEDYIRAIARALPSHNNIARRVKRADLADNLANNPPPHLRKKYEAAQKVLGAEYKEEGCFAGMVVNVADGPGAIIAIRRPGIGPEPPQIGTNVVVYWKDK